jgi:hypothetical protein
MAGVSNSFSSEKSSDGIRGFNSGNLAVGGANKSSPSLNAVFRNKFHSDDEITADELGKFFEEWLSLKN